MPSHSLSPELGLIMERFLSLSGEIMEVWDDETAETTPALIVKAAQQLYDMMSPLSEDDLQLQQEIDIDQCCDYGLHLFDEQSELASRCGLDEVSEGLEDLCFPFSLWAVRHHAEIHHLQPVVNAIARTANAQHDPGLFSSLFTDVSEIMDAVDENLRQDAGSRDPMRPWRILLLNRAVIATRSFQPVLIDAAYMDIVSYLTEDASAFFASTVEQMDQVGYPRQVRDIVETWFQRYSSKPTLH